MKKTPDISKPDLFEEQVFRGLLTEQMVIPETPDELRISEPNAAADPATLPENLRDPDAVLRRIKERITGKEGKTIPFPLPQEPDLTEELERAARNGGAIPAAIDAKMAANRRTADDQADPSERS